MALQFKPTIDLNWFLIDEKKISICFVSNSAGQIAASDGGQVP